MTTKLAAPTVLKKIFDRKTEEVAERKQRRSLMELEQLAAGADPVRGFRRALSERVAHYLAQHARRQRLGFLWCMLLGRGSPFRRLTYFHNGMAGNISEAEDVFDRLLSFL